MCVSDVSFTDLLSRRRLGQGRLSGTNGPRIEEEAGPCEHVSGPFGCAFAFEDVAILVADVASRDVSRPARREIHGSWLRKSLAAEFVERRMGREKAGPEDMDPGRERSVLEADPHLSLPRFDSRDVDGEIGGLLEKPRS